jgi:hypothetical protein
MATELEEKNKALILRAFDTLFNKRDYAAAEKLWSPNYIQHSADIAAELALMKPTSRLINTSRGPIVDEASLIKALRSHAIAGATSDVFDQEPLPAQHPFRIMDNVLATTHVGYVTENLYRIFYGDVVRDITAWLDNRAEGRTPAT